MFVLNTENRNLGKKPKQLRRKGIIPGVVYGKNLEESLSIQFPQREVVRFLQTNSKGSTVELAIGDDKFMALLREVTYTPITNELEHLSFQSLLAEEAVESTARIVLVNREKVTGLILQPQTEVAYRALPKHLVDRIDIDLDGLQEGDSIRIGDLDLAKNPNVEILTPLDIMVVSIGSRTSIAEPDGEEASETELGVQDSETETV